MTTFNDEDLIMDIYAKSGAKVIYTGKNGYDSDKEHANRYLKVGEVYTVNYTEVGGYSTRVYLQEFPKISFNSVHFIDKKDNIDKKIHTIFQEAGEGFKNVMEKMLSNLKKERLEYQRPTNNDLTIEDYKEVIEDHKRLCRELDEIINGKEGMAEQASLCDLVGQLRKEYKKEEWVNVKERMPEKQGRYFVNVYEDDEHGNFTMIAYFDSDEKYFFANGMVDIRSLVTHWMPLPKFEK